MGKPIQIKDNTTAQQWCDHGTACDVLGNDPIRTSDCYKQALRRDVFSHRAHEGLTCMWVDCGDGAQAREALQTALDLLVDPDGPDYAIAVSENSDDSTAWEICGRVALHAIHHFDLETARFALEKIPPEEIIQFQELYKISLAFGELQRLLMVDEAEAAVGGSPRWGVAEALLGKSKVMSTTSTDHLKSLPACRLNPARYAKYKRSKQ